MRLWRQRWQGGGGTSIKLPTMTRGKEDSQDQQDGPRRSPSELRPLSRSINGKTYSEDVQVHVEDCAYRHVSEINNDKDCAVHNNEDAHEHKQLERMF